MKLRHKINHGWIADRTDPAWAERIEREAEIATRRSAQQYARAKAKLVAATKRAEREQAKTHAPRSRIKHLWRVVEQRRNELLELETVAQATAAGSQHRGRGSYRGVEMGRPL